MAFDTRKNDGAQTEGVWLEICTKYNADEAMYEHDCWRFQDFPFSLELKKLSNWIKLD